MNVIEQIVKKGVAWIWPALSICNLARGRIDVFIDSGCSMEGQAAASLILANAEGAMWNYDGGPYSHTSMGGIFGNGTLKVMDYSSKGR